MAETRHEVQYSGGDAALAALRARTPEVIAPGHTFESVTESISHIVLSKRTPIGWFFGFAIAFAVVTAAAVIGVGHLIAQRQSYESSIERSYQTEMEARVEIAEGAAGPAERSARRTIAREEAHRADLRDSPCSGSCARGDRRPARTGLHQLASRPPPTLGAARACPR